MGEQRTTSPVTRWRGLCGDPKKLPVLRTLLPAGCRLHVFAGHRRCRILLAAMADGRLLRGGRTATAGSGLLVQVADRQPARVSRQAAAQNRHHNHQVGGAAGIFRDPCRAAAGIP